MKEESSETELVYELSAKNVLESKDATEVVIAIDSSYSMVENSDINLVKEKAKALARKIINQNSKAKVSISDNAGVQTGLVNDATTLNNAIDAITFGKSSSFVDAITKAKSTFTSQNSDKYIILLTDATDTVKEELIKLVDQNITVISVLYDITNNEIGTPDNQVFGPVYMFNDLDDQQLVDYINRALTNLQLKAKLTDEIIKYFDIEILTEGQSSTMDGEGISWNIDRIQNQETLKLKYKLTLKEDADIDRNIIYKNWFSAKEVTIDYTNILQKQVKLEKENTPKFTVGESYTLKIKAVNEKNDKLPVEGIAFRVEGKDEQGKIVYSNTLTTDKNGYVTINKLVTLNKVTYSIKPIVNQVGYEDTDETIVMINNDYLGKRVIEVTTDGLNYKVDDIERIVELTFPIKVQSFILEVNLSEKDNRNIVISNTEFRLIQPKLNSKYEMEALYGVTDKDGKLFFRPAVMTKPGTYDYILSQMNEQDGYSSMGNVTVRITFNDQGKITSIKKLYNDQVEAELVNDEYAKLYIENEYELTDTFDFEINLKDAVTNEPLVGASYNVVLTNSKGVSYTYGQNVTDNDGKINLKLPGTGFVSIRVTQNNPVSGYVKDTVTKDILIQRLDGEVKYIISKTPTDLDVICKTIEDKVIMNLTSMLKQDRNIVKVGVFDKGETPAYAIEGVTYKLVNETTNKEYDAITTNSEGQVEFTVDDEEPGTYRYKLVATNIPYGYAVPKVPIVMNITFDANKHIIQAGEVQGEIDAISTNIVSQDKDQLYTAYVETNLQLNGNQYVFEIDLTEAVSDEQAQRVPIYGAIYDIEISAGNFSKKIVGRPTDENGKISTRIAIDPNSVGEITITATEKSSKVGYKTDIIPQEITLNLGSKKLTHTPEANSNGLTKYAELDGDKIIYHHQNRRKDATDTFLNLNITTLDKATDAPIGGKIINITSPVVSYKENEDDEEEQTKQILDSECNELNSTKTTSTKDGEIGYVSFEDMKIVGARIPGEQTYEMDIKVDGQLIRTKLTFKYNQEKEIIELVNVEVMWGNRLVKSRNFSSAEVAEGYISDVNLEIYTDYDSTGNVSLDLKKKDLEQKEDLSGALYDIIIQRPDGTSIIKTEVPITEAIEFDGIYVPINSQIIITENKAPAGYNVNNSIILNVTAIDELTGETTLEEDTTTNSYKIPRTYLEKQPAVTLNDGTVQSVYVLEMYDVQQDVFEIKLGVKDTEGENVSGYTFELANDRGAQKITDETGPDGTVQETLGGRYNDENSPRTYTITNVKTAKYYKRLKTPIELKVYFKADETIDAVKTLSSQTDANYTATPSLPGQWGIVQVNKENEEGEIVTDIELQIIVEENDPLKVEIETVDKFTNEKIQLSSLDYEIVNNLGTTNGTVSLDEKYNFDVKYVLENGVETYKINQNIKTGLYTNLKNLYFTITYDENGQISKVVPPVTLSENITIKEAEGQTIKLQIAVEPNVPFVVNNSYYFNHDTKLSNAEFEIAREDTKVQLKTDIQNGRGKEYLGKFGNNEVIRYKVTQTSAAQGYATVYPFEIDVTYNQNREIVDVKLVDENNRFVTVRAIQPSQSTDYGYSGNDKGIIEINVFSYPEFKMNIKNVDRHTGEVIAGTNYKVTSTINTQDESVTTDENGIGIAHLDKTGFETTITYTIEENYPAVKYQSLLVPAKVEVDFDEDGYAKAIRVIKRDDVTTASLKQVVVVEDNFEVDVEIKSTKAVALNITKIDDETKTSIEKVDFTVTARIPEDELSNYSDEEKSYIIMNSSIQTEEEHYEQVLDRLKYDPEDVENIKKDIAIEALIKQLKQDNKLSEEQIEQVNSQVNSSAKFNYLVQKEIITKAEANTRINSVTYKQVVEKLVNDKTVNKQDVDDYLELVRKLVRLDVDRITTNTTGQAIAYMDKALANKTIEYTIKETKKAVGYDWPDEVVILEVTYDAQGKIIADRVREVSGNMEVTDINVDEFKINLTLGNTASKEVKIHLTVEDVYDTNKKLGTVEFDAFLTDTTNGASISADEKYRNILASNGPTKDSENNLVYPDSQEGEDEVNLGLYEENAGTRTLRLVQKTPGDEIYSYGVRTNGNKKWVKDIYQDIPYLMLFNVTFNDEGSITDTYLQSPGGETQWGWACDERYLSISHTRNTINITVRMYPMFQIGMNVQDKYTDEYLEAGYKISTTNTHGDSQRIRIKSGWIGSTNIQGWRGIVYSIGYTTTPQEKYVLSGMAPIESENTDSKERIYYIYENQEPTKQVQYQKYRAWHLTDDLQRIIAAIKVRYDDTGKVISTELIEEHSNNNITSGFTTIELINNENDHGVYINIKYAPITTVQMNVQDKISEKGISGVRLLPGQNKTPVSEKAYEYRPNFEYVTDSNGNTNWTYWGANINNGKAVYKIRATDIKDGYFKYAQDTNIEVEVTYGNDGRIASAKVLSKNTFDDYNVFVDESCYGTTNIKLTYKLERKVGLQINKKDKYDDNINLSAKFKVTSDLDTTTLGNTEFIINTGVRKEQAAGRMLAGKTVTYTLSEITVPDGYKPLDNNLKLIVKYNNDGTVASVIPADSESAKYVTVNYIEKTPRQEASLLEKDIEITITNEPKVSIDLQLVDEFYNNIKIPDTTFEITNNKGDVAVGNLTTNTQGRISTYVGSVYPGETITYTMTQKTKASGYYILTAPIQFKITFDKTGKPVDIPTFIDTYSGENAKLLTNNVTIFRQNHTASFVVYNMPEDVKLLINKYDELTNAPLQGVNFKVVVEENGTSYEINNMTTNSNGQIIKKIDTFRETQDGRIVKYTIKELVAPDTYRKVNDVVVTITYAPDGSIQSFIEESNESGLGYKIFRKGNTTITATNGNYTHFNLNVPNDNCYDLIIKDEDINYEGLGVEKTKYDITINGIEKKSTATNEVGTTSIVKNTESGNIQIRISEREIGDGYRENKKNDITLELQKAETGEYTLALNEDAMKEKYRITKIDKVKNIYEVILDEETNTKAIVEVNEEYGYVKVTFKNETKLEITLNKQDINTKVALENVKFKVTQVNLATNEEKVVLAEGVTDINGQIYIDLGVAPQNASYKYVFEELEVPNGYQVKILPQTVAVTFDMYGRISDMVCDSKLRTKSTIEHGQNCRSIQVFVGNGTIAPEYRVKVVSEDADTGFRINGSTFDVDVKDSEDKTVGNTLNSTTMNWCSNGKFYTDEELKQKQEEAEANNTKFNINILERGIIYTNQIKHKGKLFVHIDQLGFAEGYIAGTQKTGGLVELTTDFIDNPNGSLDALLKVTIDNNDGLDVVVDDTAREIIIKVKNESRLQLNIQKVTKSLDDDGKEIEVPVQGASFTVTSQVLSASAVENTDLNLTTRTTGANGVTSEAIGNTHPLKAVIYNIHENELEGYEPIEDISIYVLYDTKGYIKYYELLSSYEDAELSKDLEGTRRLDLKVRNKQTVKDYRFIIEKHNVDNELYPKLIAGIEFNIKIEEEYGETEEWNSITNYEGQIHSDYYNGYGNIKIALTEIAAVEGYKLDSRTLNVLLHRNKYNGRIEKTSSDVNIEIDEKNGIIYLKPVNEFENNKYAITIDKIDTKTKKAIENNPAKFDVIITNEAEETTYQTTIENLQTDEKGRATRYNLDIPGKVGSYIYEIVEKEAPTGYVKYDETYKFRVIVGQRPNGDLYIDSVEKLSGEHAYTFVVKPQSLAFKVENLSENDVVEDDEYLLNVYKVDEKNEPIKDIAIFKITMPDGTVKYVETDENGKLNLEHFKYPEQAGTLTYVLQEIMAPNGYILNKEPISINLEFVQQEEKIVLNSSNIVINAPGKNVSSAKLTDGAIEINVTNVKGEPSTNVDRGSYNLILTKIDADTKQIIPKEAEITVGLENGQKVLSRTKEDAKIKILEIKAPAKAGEYEYVIKETKAPDGYILNDEPQIFKITFADDPQDQTKLVITNAYEVTEGIETPIIKVKSYANNTVEVDVENKKNEDEPLYLKSKIDAKNEVIYNVYQKEDVPFTPVASVLPDALKDTAAKVYTIDEPVIDTKTMLDYKSYAGKLGTTIKEFIENLDTNAEVITIYDKNGNTLIVVNLDGNSNIVSIYDKAGKVITGDDLVKTGYKLKATKGSEELNYRISVKGDVNGDGMLSTADSTSIKRILSLQLPDQADAYNNNWSLLQKIAADNGDPMGLLTTKDSTGMKKLLAKPIPED